MYGAVCTLSIVGIDGRYEGTSPACVLTTFSRLTSALSTNLVRITIPTTMAAYGGGLLRLPAARCSWSYPWLQLCTKPPTPSSSVSTSRCRIALAFSDIV